MLLFSLPGAYLAIWMSRIALKIVNNSNYYYGLLFCFIALFTGYTAGLFVTKRHKELHWESLVLLAFGSFFISGIDPVSKMLILGFVGGLIFYGIIKNYRKFFIGGFAFGGVASFLLGGELFVSYSRSELFIGLIVFLYFLFRSKGMKYRNFFVLLNVVFFGFFVWNFISAYESERIGKNGELISNTTLGQVRVVFNSQDDIRVFDHRNNLIDYRENYMRNHSIVLPALLQRNAKDLHVLYIGYAPSLLPVDIYESPLVQQLDVMYWGGVDILKKNRLQHRFPGTEILKKRLFTDVRYDVIFVENLPNDDYISQRIFLSHAKKLLKDDQGIIVFPEQLIRTYDGRYVKPYANNKLIFVTNALTEENGENLKDRYLTLMSADRSIGSEVEAMLDEVIPQQFVVSEEIRGGEIFDSNVIKLGINTKLLQIILVSILGIYLLIRVFASRYTDNSYIFYGIENGYSLLIISLSVITLLSEYRLVYCFFAPALMAFLGFLMINYKSKFFEAVCTLALAWVFAYLLIPQFILTLQPFIFLLPFWVLSLMTEGNTIKEIGNRAKTLEPNTPRYCTLLGVFVGLIMMVLCRNQEIFSYLIYAAMLFRVMYLLKI